MSPEAPKRPAPAPARAVIRLAASVLLAAGPAGAGRSQPLPDPTSGTEAGSASVYSEETVGDVDPLAASTRWVDPARGGDMMRDRVLRSSPMTPEDAAAAAMDPAGSGRGFVYRAPGVRATFPRPVYLTYTLGGPRINGSAAREGDFDELIPPDTVFDLTPPVVAPSELTAVSAGMRIDHRLSLRVDAAAPDPPAAGPLPDPAAPRTLQPWVRTRLDASGRERLVDP